MKAIQKRFSEDVNGESVEWIPTVGLTHEDMSERVKRQPFL